MSEASMLIVGAGQAGGNAALALRERGWEGEIILLGSESHPPYERPPLSKGFLAGSTGEAQITFADAERLAGANIQWRGDARVVAIDRNARRVTLASGESLGYQKLLLATGRRPRRLQSPGAALPGVCYLRDMEDSQRLAGYLREGCRLAVVGGGFIGLEVAATAVAQGARVTVIELGPRLLMRAVPEPMAALLAQRHRAAGVELRHGVQVNAFLGEGKLEALELSDGSRLEADVAVVGIGAIPRDELASGAGLGVDNGVIVDENLATSDPDIYAAGDVCTFPHPRGEGLMRLEAWQNANDQGAHAAGNMLGANEPYRPVPWFWSDQYELTLQISGFPELAAQSVAREVGEGAAMEFYLDHAGVVVGVSGLGPSSLARDLRVGQKLVELEAKVSREVLADPATKLKQVLKQAS